MCTCRFLVHLGLKLRNFWKKKTVSMKYIHDLEVLFSNKSS